MADYEIYTDASIRFGVGGFCVAIAPVPYRSNHFYVRGVLPFKDFSVAAEVASATIGLLHCPDCDSVIVYLDIADLVRIMQGERVSWGHSVNKEIALLRKACKRFKEVEFKLVDRGNGLYRACHKRAYRQAAACADILGVNTRGYEPAMKKLKY